MRQKLSTWLSIAVGVIILLLAVVFALAQSI
mgnify:CR=1 FL=1